MPYRKSYNRAPPRGRRRRRNRRRTLTKLRLVRLPKGNGGAGGSIVPFIRRFIDSDTVTGGSTTALDLNADVKMSSVSGYEDIAKVFKWYRINKVKVTFQIPFNFAQSAMGDNAPVDQLLMVYFRRKQTSTDTLAGLTEAELLEKGDVKRKQFNSKGQVSFYFTPNTWQNLNAPSAPVNTRQRKIYKEWWENTDSSTASSAVIHSGVVGTILGVSGGNLPEGMIAKAYYTIYGQFKTMV